MAIMFQIMATPNNCKCVGCLYPYGSSLTVQMLFASASLPRYRFRAWPISASEIRGCVGDSLTSDTDSLQTPMGLIVQTPIGSTPTIMLEYHPWVEWAGHHGTGWEAPRQSCLPTTNPLPFWGLGGVRWV